MELVDSPSLFPGACTLCHGVAAPLLDTGKHTQLDERIYVCATCTGEIITATGGADRERYAQLRVVEAEAEALKVELDSTVEELQRLKDSVSTTLARGAVKPTPTSDEFKLRPKPGQKAVSL